MVASVIAVLILLVVSWLWWRGWRPPNWTRWQVRRWQRHITDLLPTKRPPKVAEARRWLEKQERRVTERLGREQAVIGSATDAAAQEEAAERADGMRGFARMLTPFEALGQWALCMAWLPTLPKWTAFTIGVAITLGIWWAIYRSFRLWHDPDRPARSIRVARWTAGIASVIAAIGGVIYGTARFAFPQYFANLEGVIFGSLIALAEIGPIAAGAASFGAWVADKPVRAASRIASLAELQEELATFTTWLDEHAPTPAAPVAPHLVEASNA